ncbi:MAG TPA: hypothetical protein VF595_00215 [Tepidisphaeraceae bacterium]|jgi:hypothetical protein
MNASAPYDPAAPAPARRAGVRLPAWLAWLIIVLAGAGLLYLAVAMLRPPPPIDLSQYEPNDTGRRPFRLNRTNGPQAGRPEGVNLEPNGNGTAWASTLTIQFLVNGAKPNLLATSAGNANVPASDRAALAARTTALNLAEARKQASVTDDQTKRLRGFTPVRTDPLDATSRTRLLDLWAKYRAADGSARPAMEKDLLDSVRKLAAAHAAARQSASLALADQVRSVLNTDQIAKLNAKR